MSAHIIDGKKIASDLRRSIADKVSGMDAKPGLAVILVGGDPASQVYVRNKIKATEEVGMRSMEYRLPDHATQDEIALLIQTLNDDDMVQGILLQLPLPRHLNADPLIQMIAPEKDVDGLTFVNAGKLVAGEPSGLVSCTPQGALMLIKTVKQDLTGLNAVVIGRSLLFGKPMATLLVAESCTVTTAHSKTRDLPAICRNADILVAAVGRSELVKADWVKPGAIVIDVGINRQDDGKLKGDVDFAGVSQVASAITPVPGGVGPMTIACLLNNTLKASA